MKKNISVVRKFLLWWFSKPNSPWVNVNLSIDFTYAQSYLKQLNKNNTTQKVTVQHLICASITRALMAVPEANSRIVAGRIIPQSHIGIAMPVNLLGHEVGKKRELSLLLLRDTQKKSLRMLAEEGRDALKKERSGKMTAPFLKNLLKVGERLSPAAMHRFLEGFDRLLQRPRFAQYLYDSFPVTTALSNPGAALPSDVEGILFRSCNVELPTRLIHVGTFFAASAVQDEVIPIEGKPAVRPMLPIMLIFDHRLIDGMKASKLLLEIMECIKNPEDTFGANGQALP